MKDCDSTAVTLGDHGRSIEASARMSARGTKQRTRWSRCLLRGQGGKALAATRERDQDRQARNAQDREDDRADDYQDAENEKNHDREYDDDQYDRDGEQEADADQDEEQQVEQQVTEQRKDQEAHDRQRHLALLVGLVLVGGIVEEREELAPVHDGSTTMTTTIGHRQYSNTRGGAGREIRSRCVVVAMRER